MKNKQSREQQTPRDNFYGQQQYEKLRIIRIYPIPSVISYVLNVVACYDQVRNNAGPQHGGVRKNEIDGINKQDEEKGYGIRETALVSVEPVYSVR
jgi:hypothetical protein